MNKKQDERFKVLTGEDNWNTAEASGLPKLRVSDGPHGLRFVIKEEKDVQFAETSTCYPTLSALGNSFDRALVSEVGKAIAEDCIEHDVAIILGPGVNIKRTPLCGRNFEYFSEDGVLSGELAKAYIEGVQSKGIGTSLKHFAANNREYDRFFQSSELDERTLRETYCRAFEIAVQAEPWTVMCSYNPVNGVYASENRFLLQTVLRENLGFRGVVLSDWGAVKHRAKSLKAGVDLAMPYSPDFERQLEDWYSKGLLSDDELEKSIERLKELATKYSQTKPLRKALLTIEQKHALAVRAARESAVLLKNEAVLPLRKDRAVAVIGAFSEKPEYQGGGSSRVESKPQATLHGLLAEKGYDVTYASAYMIRGDMIVPFGVRYALDVAKDKETAVVCVGNTWLTEKEETDRYSLKLPPAMEDLILCVAQETDTVVLIYAGSAVDVSAFQSKVKGILYLGYAGEGVNEAAAELLCGSVSPCGKLAETFPKSLEQTCTADKRGNFYHERYEEGVFVGYKYYDRINETPAYPFGYGMSYSRFEYSDLSVTKIGETEYEIGYDVANVGDFDAYEIAQVYISPASSMVSRPKKELAAFEKQFIQKGERCRFTHRITARNFAYFSPVLRDWYVENGKYKLQIGASSTDIRLSADIIVRLPDEEQFSKF